MATQTSSPLQALGGLRRRQRETGSLCLAARPLLRSIIRSTQGTRFGPYVTPQTFELSSEGSSFASAEREYEDGPRFFTHFPDHLTGSDLAGLDVLDLGCGYGGRTVYYADEGQTKSITGIEISTKMVERCRGFAEQRGQPGIRFDVAFGEDLPYPAASYDTVLSYDVLEHVQDPRAVLREIHRVLRPGGRAWLVFPSYLGARASHLDYLTQIPGLHRVFDPDAIIEVVNEFLEADPERYGVKVQPRPEVGVFGRRPLPTLNGMCRSEAHAAIAASGFEIDFARVDPLITEAAPVPLAGPVTKALRAWGTSSTLPELLVGHLAFGLRKPG